MRKLIAALASFLVSGLVASSAIAQATFTGLGVLPGRDESVAVAISADGTSVVGYVSFDEAWRWTASTGMVAIGDLPGGGENSFATGVSSDGSVIVGRSSSSPGSEAFRWTEAGGMVGLGDLPGGSFTSFAWAVSDDGTVIVGDGSTNTGNVAARCAQWVPIERTST